MRHVLIAMRAQVAYMFAAGFSFLLVPNLVLKTIGIAPVTDAWIRVLGLLTACLAIYYVVMIRERSMSFIWTTVWVRYLFCTGLAVLTATGFTPWQVYGFAAFEASLTVWSHLALRQLPQKT